jgi:flagellar biosynthesis protein FliR
MEWGNTGIDWTWLIRQAGVYALVSARVLGLCLTAPALAIPELDWRFRLVLVAVLGAVLSPVVAMQVVLPGDWPGAAWAGFGEVLTGAVLGWSAALIVAGARLAGDLVAGQAGLSTAALLDPDTGEEMTVLGRLYGLVALALFLSLDGPLALVQALAESYRALPVGRLFLLDETAQLAFGQVGRVLELALRAAAPAALALALAALALAWLGRATSSMPFITLALPIRLILGIVLVSLSLAALVMVLSNAWTAFLVGR